MNISKKTKIFPNYKNAKQLEEILDNFMESIHVTDIKYSCYCDKGIVYHSALVLYEVVNI